MLHIIETIKDIESIKDKTPDEICQLTLAIIKNLDDRYGAERDMNKDNSGGLVLIAENIQDLADIAARYFPIDNNRHECVDFVQCEKEPYINALFLHNNEAGTNVLIPLKIAPQVLLDELRGEQGDGA